MINVNTPARVLGMAALSFAPSFRFASFLLSWIWISFANIRECFPKVYTPAFGPLGRACSVWERA